MGVVSEVGWCTDPAMASDVARFFVAHADPAYISHAELQGGRALGPGRWSPDLEARIAREAARAIAGVASDVEFRSQARHRASRPDALRDRYGELLA